MAGQWLWMRIQKLGSWQRCSRFIQEQRTRLYIIWKCSEILLHWNEDEFGLSE